MDRPLKKPKWATASGAIVAEPLETKKESGWEYAYGTIGEKPIMDIQNWLHKTTYEWIEYLDEVTRFNDTTLTKISSSSNIYFGGAFFIDASSEEIQINVNSLNLVENQKCTFICKASSARKITFILPLGYTFEDGSLDGIVDMNGSFTLRLVNTTFYKVGG